jgi:hypothetical protein
LPRGPAVPNVRRPSTRSGSLPPPLVLALVTLLRAADAVGGDATPAGAPATARENLLRGPARCALRYLEAVRLAGPRGPELRATPAHVEQRYRDADQLVAPRALAEITRRTARGEDHPLAPWRTAARGAVLESFQLLAVRRAPRGAAVVTVRERWWQAAGGPLAALTSEYLLGRVEGEWKVLDRRPGAPFLDEEVAEGYTGWFDPPGAAPRRPPAAR